MSEQPIRVLVVDDNPGDILLVQEAFEELHVEVEVLTADGGEEAVAVLAGAVAEAALPDLVVLDLNMPGMDGMAVLDHIRGADALRHLPVVILTSTSAQDEIMRAYRHQASSFVTKPHDPGDLLEAMRSLDDFWLRVARLPRS